MFVIILAIMEIYWGDIHINISILLPYKTTYTGKLLWQVEELPFFLWISISILFFPFVTFVFLCYNTIIECHHGLSDFIFHIWLKTMTILIHLLFLWQHLNKFFTFVNLYQTCWAKFEAIFSFYLFNILV